MTPIHYLPLIHLLKSSIVVTSASLSRLPTPIPRISLLLLLAHITVLVNHTAAFPALLITRGCSVRVNDFFDGVVCIRYFSASVSCFLLDLLQDPEIKLICAGRVAESAELLHLLVRVHADCLLADANRISYFDIDWLQSLVDLVEGAPGNVEFGVDWCQEVQEMQFGLQANSLGSPLKVQEEEEAVHGRQVGE